MTSQLKKINAEDFKKDLLEKYKPKAPAEQGYQMVKNLKLWSYAPNAVSAISATFFVWYLISTYSLLVQVALGGILGFAVIANEIAKRKLISHQSKRYYTAKQLGAAIIFLIVCVAASIYSSYRGGNEIVKQNAVAPTLPVPGEILQIQDRLNGMADDIARQKATTWKGRITVDANRNLKTLYNTQALLSSQLADLQTAYRAKQEKLQAQHEVIKMNGGIVLGSICIFADIVLIFLLASIERIQYNTYRLETYIQNKTKATSPTTLLNGSTPTASFSGPAAGINRTEVKGFLPGVKNAVKNVLNEPLSDLERAALITGHTVRAGSYSKRKKPGSQAKANYHRKRAEELKKKAVS